MKKDCTALCPHFWFEQALGVGERMSFYLCPALVEQNKVGRGKVQLHSISSLFLHGGPQQGAELQSLTVRKSSVIHSSLSHSLISVGPREDLGLPPRSLQQGNMSLLSTFACMVLVGQAGS